MILRKPLNHKAFEPRRHEGHEENHELGKNVGITSGLSGPKQTLWNTFTVALTFFVPFVPSWFNSF
jgi:hypothetical protein